MSKVLKITGFVIAVAIAVTVAVYAIQAFGSRSATPAAAPVSVLEGKLLRGQLYWDARRAERKARDQAATERRERLVRESEERLAKTPHRRVRRFSWMSPTATMGQRLALPLKESNATVLEAFVRICVAEADGHLQDCVGVWQVMKNIRRTRCTRGEVRRITECEELEGQDGVTRLRETMISVMRRAQPHIMAMGQFKTNVRNSRAAWIRNLTTDCENPPANYPGKTKQQRLDDWDFRYRKRCGYVVQLGEYLLKGKLPPDRPGVNLEWLPGRPITWGGDCSSGKASCDDPIACSRGLARVKGGPKTHNAFWCRPGRGCSDTIDPMCAELGYAIAQADAGVPEQSTDIIDIDREERTNAREQQDAGAGDHASGVATVPPTDGPEGVHGAAD
jgi:hypothetical protein